MFESNINKPLPVLEIEIISHDVNIPV